MNHDHYVAIADLDIAVVGITADDDAVTGVDFLPQETATKDTDNPVTSRFIEQFKYYLSDPESVDLDIPVKVQGTEFQQRVWDALKCIPAGTTMTYGELARQLNTGARAVGNACRKNPVPLIVPCHRVVSSQGLGGFSGDRNGGWTAIKRKLLAHEGYTTG